MPKKMELRNNQQVRRVNYFYILKSLLIISSLVLLIFVLVQLNDIYVEPTFRERENFEPIIISILITVIFLISTLTLLTLREYRSYITRRSYIQSTNSYLSLEDIFEN